MPVSRPAAAAGPARLGRTNREILRANVFTRFNAILGSLLVIIAVVGPWQDTLFVLVPVVNTAIGVVEEVRAKRTLDRLAVLTAPRARLMTENQVRDVEVAAVRIGDRLEIRPGDQLVADGEVLESRGLEVDESLLTGEAEPAAKGPGDRVLSGTVAVAGTGVVRTTATGASAYVVQLEADARRFKSVRSELQAGTNRILRVVSWLMAPAALVLVSGQFWRSHETIDSAVRGSVAGVASMVPEGLVLLTTMAFALGALRMARRRVLIQALPAIEGLARVDVVCLDKTGTLTYPGMRVHSIEDLGADRAEAALRALAGSDPAPNATVRALAELGGIPEGWRCETSVPFSSRRRWSAATFQGRGAYVLGAPEVLLAGRPADSGLAGMLQAHAEAGRRVLLLARAPGLLPDGELPRSLRPAAVVSVEERLRPEAAETLAFLGRQGVAIKILSGDDPRTAAAIARLAGLRVVAGVDARGLPADPEALASALEANQVFGRVDPELKRGMIAALQSRGHVVAMTGDGVNDVPALKQADIGMAMGSGSPASRAVGQVVLLDSSFAAVPGLLREGRRVIANIERVASVVVTKTVYAATLAILVGVLGWPFPLYPRYLTVVAAWTIGIPGFFLTLGLAAPLARSGFVRRVLLFTLPAGLAAAGATVGAYLVAAGGVSDATARTSAALALLTVGLWALAYLARPLTPLRLLLVLGMAAGAALTMAIPFVRNLFSLRVPPFPLALEVLGVAVAACFVATVALLALRWIGGPHPGGVSPLRS